MFFEPRFFLAGIADLAGRHGDRIARNVSVALGIALLAIGIVIVRSRSLKSVKLYLFVETVLALPTLLIFVSVLAANLSPAHGLSIGEIIFPMFIFSLATVLPYLWAIHVLRGNRLTGTGAVGA